MSEKNKTLENYPPMAGEIHSIKYADKEDQL